MVVELVKGKHHGCRVHSSTVESHLFEPENHLSKHFTYLNTPWSQRSQLTSYYYYHDYYYYY